MIGPSRLKPDVRAAEGSVGEIQKADLNARRTVLVIVGCGALLGIAMIKMAGALRPDLQAWVERDEDVRLRIVLAAVTLLTAGPVLGVAGYLWHLGRRIVRVERYPPPGFRVVRDTPVVIGKAASRHGRLVQAFAAVVGAAGLLLAFFLWRLFFLLRPGAV